MKPFKASLDNWELNILDVSDTLQASLVRHEFLNSDGAILNNFGNKAREVRFKAYFFGPTTPSTGELNPPSYANHFLFLQYISDSSQEHTLTHPKYGEITGYVESITAVHNDTQDYVEIDITFIENNIQSEGFISDPNAINQVLIQRQVDLRNAELAKISSEMQQKGVGALLGKAINFSQSMNSQFAKLTAPARKFVQEADAACTKFDRLLSSVTQPIDTVESAVSLAADVPTRIMTSITHAIDRVVYSLANLSKVPTTVADSVVREIGNMCDAVTGEHADFYKKHIKTLGAGQVAQVCANAYQDDQVNTDTAKAQEATPTFDAAGRRVSILQPVLIMSADEVEAILATTRNLIEDVILLDRDNDSLMTIAADLVTYADTVKIDKKRVVIVNTNSIPIHVLCSQYGLSYHAAERVMGLNPGIHNPTFATGNVSIYVD